jgi:hypothetical protein
VFHIFSRRARVWGRTGTASICLHSRSVLVESKHRFDTVWMSAIIGITPVRSQTFGQLDAEEEVAGRHSLGLKPTPLHLVRHVLGGHPALAGLLGELLVALEEASRTSPARAPHLAVLGYEAPRVSDSSRYCAHGLGDDRRAA